MDTTALASYIEDYWDAHILPTLTEFIRIPCLSPSFDKEWKANGHMHRAVKLVMEWMEAQGVEGLRLRVVEEGDRTPLILGEVPGTDPTSMPGTVLMYGHVDKQPEMVGWREDLGPWKPVMDGEGRLYGRGGADDGYAAFASIAAIRALQQAGLPHPNIRLLIECSEESGSVHLPHYLQSQGEALGDPGLVVCLDSGCGNYEQLWSTTSLRGIVGVTLKVEILSAGVHSGMGGGIVPNPMLVMRQLLDRLEDGETGRMLPPGLHVDIPPQRVEQAAKVAQVLGGSVSAAFPFVEGGRPLSDSTQQLLLNNSWEPALAVIGQDGLPPAGEGGNVLLPGLTFRLSVRIPPGLKVSDAVAALKGALEPDPPFGARVTVSAGGEPGWDAPPLAPWLEQVTDAASREFYGREACYAGLGGSIPFMNMMGERFPNAQFLITGVLGPHSNAHGPNEFLHVPYAKKLTCCIARVLQAGVG